MLRVFIVKYPTTPLMCVHMHSTWQNNSPTVRQCRQQTMKLL